MGDERSRERTALNRLQHRTLDLEVVVGLQVVTDRAQHLEADVEDVPRLLVDHEVDVALTRAQLDVVERLVLVGRRTQRLAQQRERLHADGDLAAPRPHDHTRHADPVTTVEVVEVMVRLVADRAGVDKQLDVAGAVLQYGERQLALPTNELQPTREADLRRRSPFLPRGRRVCRGSAERCS